MDSSVALALRAKKEQRLATLKGGAGREQELRQGRDSISVGRTWMG